MTRMAMFVASVALAASAHAQTWPVDAAWIALDCGGVPSFDARLDEPAAMGARDVVGDSMSPALYYAVDGTQLFFRMRVDADPGGAGGDFVPFGWAVELDTDAVRETYELIGVVDGIATPDEVVLGRNTAQAAPNDPADPYEVQAATYPATTHARAIQAAGPFASSFGADADYFVDLALDLSDLAAEGVDPTSVLLATMGTSTNAQGIDADLACSLGGTDPGTLTWVLSDPVRPDGVVIVNSDGDCLTDAEEAILGTNPRLTDTDGDGYDDCAEVRAGSDPRNANSVPTVRTGVGLRGGPGGCSIGARATDLPWAWLLVACLVLRRRR